MDREVLFRGKRTDNDEWIYGYCFYDHFYKKAYITLGDYCMQLGREYPNKKILTAFEVIPKTVGQFIGRYDKNNKKIFNNDIVKTKYGRECVVVWFSSNKYNAWDLKPVENYERKAPDKYDIWSPENLEVVGNVFDDKTKTTASTPPSENLSN